MVDDDEAVERGGTRADLPAVRRFELTTAVGSDQSWPVVRRGKSAASRSGTSAGERPMCEAPGVASRSSPELESEDVVVVVMLGNQTGWKGETMEPGRDVVRRVSFKDA